MTDTTGRVDRRRFLRGAALAGAGLAAGGAEASPVAPIHGARHTDLPRPERAGHEHVDAVLGDLVEPLASVATLCDPRRTA
ncbi:twin-arginine translocation signal domain-containing protein [Streptomyces shenzhenensis]|uniref:twin-arginine translocation signal domain-containing protein n=1 Tax=Streptomyces shenzhenensis TaxID=943815 RepID=UPI0033FB4B6A